MRRVRVIAMLLAGIPRTLHAQGSVSPEQQRAITSESAIALYGIG